MAYENIIYEVNEGIATITFNRPKALNALNGALWRNYPRPWTKLLPTRIYGF